MGMKKNNGFTIIEVTLFLGLSGLLIAAVLVGATRNINNQRYRDTVEQTRNVIQGQYDRVYSLTNSDETEAGSANPCTAESETIAEIRHRGTTECLYVGRLIEVRESASSDAETELRMTPVVAKSRAEGGKLPSLFGASGAGATAATSGDLTSQYQIYPHAANEQLVETWPLDWGLRVVRPGGDDEQQNVSILILRSPINGSLSTHIVGRQLLDAERQDLGDIITGTSDPQAVLCVIEPAGVFGFAGVITRMAITVDANSAGPGGVRSVGESESGC